jgi:hypothetical protein
MNEFVNNLLNDEQNKYLLYTQTFIFALLIGIPLIFALEIKSLIIQGFLVLLICIILYTFFSLVNSKTSTCQYDTNQNEELDEKDINNIKNIYEEKRPLLFDNKQKNLEKGFDGEKMEHDIRPIESITQRGLSFPVNGPLDHLSPDELVNRLNYLYYATSHPYQPISYIDYKSHSDLLLDSDINSAGSMKATNAVKNIERSELFYPQLTADQINYRDCTNHAYGPLSCNQQPDENNLYPIINETRNEKYGTQQRDKSLLVSGINENNIKLVFHEDFNNIGNIMNSKPAPINDNLNNNSNNAIIFKNAPSIVQDNSCNLCRHCKIGYCNNGICLNKN